MRNWWKWLGAAILLYVFIAGLLVPLKPGITNLTPTAARTGDELKLEVKGYNSHFAQAEDSMRVWLRLEEGYNLAARQIEVHDEETALAHFTLPEYLPIDNRVGEAAVIVDNAIDGTTVLSGVMLIRQDSINPARGQAGWPKGGLDELHSFNGFAFPFLNNLEESIRNLYFHVALWFAMTLLLLTSVIYSVRYLRHPQHFDHDYWAMALASAGVTFGFLGLTTGAIWARYTWGSFWSWDIKQILTLIALMIYLAYFVLRTAFPDQERRGRVSAVYNIFAFVAMLILIGVLPRLESVESLHPGNGGNPGLGGEDLENTMKAVFYPAIIGWTL
ncbi:MAG: cytochrome c biogenesis protein CcsA, partial [Lewinella sp.]|nr:cytochrome c biogenesis protein CcsA [Lewinella sp.]